MLITNKKHCAVHLQGFSSAFAKHDASTVATMGESFDYKSVMMYDEYAFSKVRIRRSQCPRVLRCGCAAARLLRLWVRIPPGGAWISVCCECWVLSGKGLCDGLITRPEESYRLLRVDVCDLETSRMSRPWPIRGCFFKHKKRC